ncbi:ubiquitin carboxyl-terminal hydrolase 43 isoform X1 [Colossoma macropomum]|uniref:ubiquitin carboxyl-terminal hydrolase 43 isoform X1 n=1 Tax=Colossoma macropomum TaxID=42526 RepID=UPI001864FF6F|nr:ubiquitin carboxyl-terminal hydrolase 43 isoform X1 [Colossoma macropomum]
MERGEQQRARKARAAKNNSNKRKDRKSKQVSGKALFRKKSLKSVGSFVSKVFRSLGAWAHGGGAPPADSSLVDAEEDDEGGFRDGGAAAAAAAAAACGSSKEDGRGGVRSCSLQSWHTSAAKERERLSLSYGDKTPGVLGLKNHGNTCFMNAVVQCLSNTDLLAEYLGLERYRSDLSQKRVNGAVKEEDSQPGAGEVTEQLAALVRALWTLEYTPQLSVEFKVIVSKYGAQFRGNSQHDALEFLLWLLDRIHEDVNSSSPSTSKTCGKGLAGGEEMAASECPNPDQPGVRHSFVQEHFQAQYKSSLTCPHCLKQSHTFDPFLCISLPIPLRQTRPLCVTLVFSSKGQRYLRVGLAVPLFGSLACLRRMVADEGKISPDQVILTEIYTTGFQRSFFDEDDLTSIAESDIIYAFQAPPLYIRGGSTRISGYHHSLPSSPYSSSGPEAQRLAASGALSSEFLNQGAGTVKILLLVCNAAGAGQQAVRFGPPFLMREDRSVSWDQLQQSILSKLYYLMINGAQPQNTRVLFKIRVVGSSISCSYLSPQDGRPLYHPAVDRALKLCGSGGPPHVKLIVEWEHRIKDCLFGNIQEEVVKDSESVRTQQQQHVQQHSCTLDECFQLYTKEEQLAPDDAWKCPHCKQLQQGMVQMSLWTLPDILILHLKRFRQVGERRNKLSTLVRFPLTALDMAPHVVKRSNFTRLPPGWKHQAQRPETAQHAQDFLYDLYAVCNHHGGMHGGHYTAYCRNSVDGQWYGYDDSSVEPVPEGEVCTRGAYILFYQRRNSIPAWSASCSVRGSTTPSTSNHWLIRLKSLTGESQPSSPATKTSSSSSAPEPQTPTTPVFHEQATKGDSDGFESRPFVRGTQGRSVSMRSPSKSKENLGKVLPLRWSFGSKDRKKPTAIPEVTPTQPGELVEYLESGRRPRCTKEPIVSLVASPPQVKAQLQEGDSLSSPSGSSSFSGMERGSCPGTDSPRVPEGQSRPVPDRGTSNSNAKGRDEGLVSRRSSKRSKQEQHGKTQDGQSHQGSTTGMHSGTSVASSTPASRDSTLKRLWSQPAGATRTPHNQIQPEDSTGSKREEARGQDGILSFLKTGTLKKDKSKEESVKEGKTLNNKNSSKLSVSNGTLNGVIAEQKKPSGAHRSSNGQHNSKALVNGRENHNGSASVADIKRAHSSSSIQSRLDLNLRRTVSLQRSGPLVPPHKALTADKPSFATLQRARYSTTSLGRQRPVPESCF